MSKTVKDFNELNKSFGNLLLATGVANMETFLDIEVRCGKMEKLFEIEFSAIFESSHYRSYRRIFGTGIVYLFKSLLRMSYTYQMLNHFVVIHINYIRVFDGKLISLS